MAEELRSSGQALQLHASRQVESRARSTEERFRLLIESTIDYAIFTMDDDGRVETWNAGAERMFGYRADEIIGRDAALIFTPEDRVNGVPEQELARARITGRAHDERWHIRRDGSRLYSSGVVTRLGDVGFAKIARDLTLQRQASVAFERAHRLLEERVTERTAELHAEVVRHAGVQDHVLSLLREIVTAQEDERARIARDLHDQLGQQLTALRLTLEQHRESLGDDRCEDLDRALMLTEQINNQVDFLAWELRPAALDDFGLTAALPRFLREWSAHHRLCAEFQTIGRPIGRLPPPAETTFYRVAQEALTNAMKHARATRVDVVLEGRQDCIVLIVEDDGVGFGVPGADSRGIGLIGMRERAALIGGTLQIESAPGNGTTVYLRYPLVDAASQG